MLMIKWVVDDDKLDEIRNKHLPLLISFPDTGLISHIAGSHIISNLKLDYVGYIDAEWAPPFVSFINGNPLPPMRIYCGNDICVFYSEIPLDSSIWHLVARELYLMYDRLRPSLALGGVGLPYVKRETIVDRRMLRVFVGGLNLEYVKNHEKIKRYLSSVKMFTGGLYGIYATILQVFSRTKLPVIIHIIDSFPYFPDVDAAIVYLEHLKEMIDLKIDIKPLEEKASEIKILARSLSRQVQDQHMSRESAVVTGSRTISSIYM